MICINCAKAFECPKLAVIYNNFENFEDFSVNKCKEHEDSCKYKKIAEHDDLMRLLYDFFTGQIEGDYSDEEIIESIKTVMMKL